jgi:hypothetical protein
MAIPNFFASSERETIQPSLLLKTTMGAFCKVGAKSRSQEQ